MYWYWQLAVSLLDVPKIYSSPTKYISSPSISCEPPTNTHYRGHTYYQKLSSHLQKFSIKRRAPPSHFDFFSSFFFTRGWCTDKMLQEPVVGCLELGIKQLHRGVCQMWQFPSKLDVQSPIRQVGFQRAFHNAYPTRLYPTPTSSSDPGANKRKTHT